MSTSSFVRYGQKYITQNRLAKELNPIQLCESPLRQRTYYFVINANARGRARPYCCSGRALPTPRNSSLNTVTELCTWVTLLEYLLLIRRQRAVVTCSKNCFWCPPMVSVQQQQQELRWKVWNWGGGGEGRSEDTEINVAHI
ncbi:hypothetical protein, unlikely [Trypanosoma brucei gambiense DAL972]|uniref:Uncharacterized protein n=1 Tax=Trypanosoma brucei gambiense (strain MHOM/CI/86/DAL972) TaxID=679716 RepID=C9ZW51_TRYB9|nr:hypothetical protein, unlikely [Trypanosoma brucei gambiense DAL972]CBH13640.1 hypothetical protein, unlikely [Trypanosoma brucei gambiense DAL972]|eukprot:XP_011775916.1 hypothetical protein, unlikely [Trypanosoma brucei gambiense DAL972]